MDFISTGETKVQRDKEFNPNNYKHKIKENWLTTGERKIQRDKEFERKSYI